MQSVAREARDVTKAFDAISSKGRGAATALDAMGDEALQTAGGLDAVAAAGDRAAQGARGVTESHIVAAGSVGNLTAQFNDIGVMLAAGQNPLQLAIQQGTQIGQVFQQSGATGRDAFKMLLSGATAMLSPINLITIGSIAAGAAMYQWLSSSGEEAESLEDILERLGGRVDDFRDRATRSASDIREEFGNISPEIARMIQDLQDIGREGIEADAKNAAEALVQNIGQSALAFARELSRAGNDGASDAIRSSLSDLFSAEEISGQIAGIEKLLATVDASARAAGGLKEEYRAFRNEVVQTEEDLRAAEQSLISSGLYAAEVGANLVQSAREYLNTRLEQWSAAQDILAGLREENEIQRLSLQHGAESVEVAEARATAARRAFEAEIEALGVTGDLADEMRRAFEHKQALSLLDITSGISSAASEAERLANWLGIAVSRALAISTTTPAMADEDAVMGQQVIPDASVRARQRQAVANFDRITTPRGSSGSRGGGGGERDKAAKELERQREAVERLIESEQRQLDILRETDPVQKEMLRNRETLAAATEAERAQIEEIIATRQREEQAIARTQERAEFFQQTSYDALRGLIRGGDEAASAIDRMAAALEDAALQALLLGEGPLAGLLGGGSGGGLIGVIGSALGLESVPQNADGGMQYARGDSRSDGGLSWISSGEFIVNARATSQNRALLEAINSGSLSIGSSLPAFAAGGAFGGGAAMPADGGRPVIQLIDQTGRGVNVTAEEDTLPSGQRRTRFVLADAVGDALTMPGGRARRALGSAYGLKTTGPKR
ncbi:phage tail length tape measure family protein [Thalassococcus profundi]|nr:phage tail length tape measure family protein [Thalassococcus profundi]